MRVYSDLYCVRRRGSTLPSLSGTVVLCDSYNIHHQKLQFCVWFWFWDFVGLLKKTKFRGRNSTVFQIIKISSSLFLLSECHRVKLLIKL